MPYSGGSSSQSQGTGFVLGGAAGVSDVFGTWGRDRLRSVAAFFALRCFLAGRVERFAVAFARVALLPRFVRLVLVVRRFAMRSS